MSENEIMVDGAEPEKVDEPFSEKVEPDVPDVTDVPAEPSREELLARISELENELSSQKKTSEKRKAELSELAAVFPEVDPDALPDEVVRQNEAGIPLAAAYALYERVKKNELETAQAKNRENSISLNPALGFREEVYFSAEEVKKMSPRQVRENFSGIKRSMKHWGSKK